MLAMYQFPNWGVKVLLLMAGLQQTAMHLLKRTKVLLYGYYSTILQPTVLQIQVKRLTTILSVSYHRSSQQLPPHHHAPRRGPRAVVTTSLEQTGLSATRCFHDFQKFYDFCWLRAPVLLPPPSTTTRSVLAATSHHALGRQIQLFLLFLFLVKLS